MISYVRYKRCSNKIDKLDFIKIENLCFKGQHQESKKQPVEWEKILADHIFDKGLLSRI